MQTVQLAKTPMHPARTTYLVQIIGALQRPSGDHGPPCVLIQNQNNPRASVVQLRPQSHRALVALKLPAEDRRDVARSVDIPVEGPMTNTLAVLGPPVVAVLLRLVMAVVAHLRSAELVDNDHATLTGERVADLGDRRGRQALHRRRKHTVAKDGNLQHRYE